MDMYKEYKYKLPQLDLGNDETAVRNHTTDTIDKDWIRLTLFASIEEYDEDHLKYLYRSSVMTETMSTELGGHLAINPPYSFCRNADIPYRGRMAENVEPYPETEDINIGMGRFYAESNQQYSRPRTLYLQFGVPNFQSIFAFFTNSLDYAKGIIAREGRLPIFYYAGVGLGTAAAYLAFPIFTVSFYLLTGIARAITGLPDPRYYSLKPAMGNYWQIVNTIVNTLAVERGLIGLTVDEKANNEERIGMPIQIDKSDLAELHKLMPHVFKGESLIDVMGIAGRYQKLLNEQMEIEYKLLGPNGNGNQAAVDNALRGLVTKKPHGDYVKFLDNINSLQAYRAKKRIVEAEPVPQVSSSGIDPDDYKVPDDKGRRKILPHQKDSWFQSMKEYFKASVLEGGTNAILQVEYVGSSTDSFSNSVKDIPLKSVMNSVGGAFRDVRFSLSDFNLAGSAVDSVVKAGRDTAMGILDGATFGISGVIQALTGGGFVEFPKMWDNSTANISNHTFKMKLGGPYGNPISMMMDIDLPLAMLLAGTLPLSIGRAGYTSPYLCNAFIQGITNIDFGMITSLTITRGGGKLGHSVTGAPLELDVSFTITDFSEIISAPLEEGVLGALGLALDDYQGINRYMKVLSGQSYTYTKFFSKKALLRVSKEYTGISSYLSPEGLGMRLGLSGPGSVIAGFMPDMSGIKMFQ